MALNLFGWLDKKEQHIITEAVGSTIENEEGWRKLTGDADRTLSPMSQTRMQELAVYLWKTNPLADRLIEIPVAYLLAEGVSLKCEDAEASEWLKQFWNDPINNMDIKLPKKVRELAIYGEQCYPVFVNEMNGHTRLGYLDPGLIDQIITDPDNIEQPIGVITKKDKKGNYRKYKIIINGDESVFSERTQNIRESFADGDCFYFTVNDLCTSSRGHSDLLSQMDWLDAHDHALFGELERWDFLRSFVWDVTLKGATPDEVAKRASQITSPSSGSVRVHNEGEEWNAITPDMKAADSEGLTRLFKNHIIGGATLPEHWFGSGGDVNRATAGEMGEPTFKMLTMRQTYVGYMLAEIGTYVIRERLKALYGAAPEDSDTDYEVTTEWPEMTAKDTTKYAAALSQVVIAAATAIDRSMMARDTAIGLIVMIAGQLGLEIDAAKELEKIEEDMAKKKEDDSFVVGDG